jgi:hypothetical protein
MNMEQQEHIPQKIMSEIHRLVQKLKDSGMAVDSNIETITTLVDDTVKYTDKLTITGKFEQVRFDTRTPEQVKEAMLEEKARLQAQADEVMAKVDEVIAVVDSKQK